jgi:hypothetical protein
VEERQAALIDAAIVYGANRWLRGLHAEPTWEFQGRYKPEHDKRLFSEFLHLLLLFDRIVLDNSSIERIGQEIREMFAHVNTQAGSPRLLSYREVATTKSLLPVISATCEMISDSLRSGLQSFDALSTIAIPWAYCDKGHMDYEKFFTAAAECGLDTRHIPLAIFAYRGLAYAGFAHAQAGADGSDIATYVAAPGRISALQPFLDSRVIADLDYPRKAYGSLVETLKLPSKGYDFSFLGVFSPSQVSSLALEIDARPPRDALRWILRRRRESDAVEVRMKWCKQLQARHLSKIVGTNISQSATGNQVGGDLIQIAVGTSVW